MFFTGIWFVETSTRIVKYESRVVKSNPGSTEISYSNKLHYQLFYQTYHTSPGTILEQFEHRSSIQQILSELVPKIQQLLT